MTARPDRRRVRGRVAGATLAALTLALALAGCAADSAGESPSAGMPDRAAAPEVAGGGGSAAEAPGANPAPSGGRDASQQNVQVEERALIYTGSISVKVDNVGAKADRARDIATGLGGAVGGDQRTLDGDRSEAQIILRVPSERFHDALAQVAGLGTEESRSVSTDDVTEQLVDLDARLATQRASVDRVRALLAQATTIGEIVSIESELTRREAELASLEQRKERLSGLVALSTITATLRGPGAAPPPEPDTGFVAGLRSGWDAFLASVQILLTVAGWLLPWAIAIFLPIWFLIWLLRRRRPPAAARPAAAPAPFAGPPGVAPNVPGSAPVPVGAPGPAAGQPSAPPPGSNQPPTSGT